MPPPFTLDVRALTLRFWTMTLFTSLISMSPWIVALLPTPIGVLFEATRSDAIDSVPEMRMI